MSDKMMRDYGMSVLFPIADDGEPLSEVPESVKEILDYNWSATRAELLFQGVELGKPTYLVGEVDTDSLGNRVQGFGWFAQGMDVASDKGDFLARIYLTQAVRAGAA